MLLISEVTDQTNGNCQVSVTHTVSGDEHFIRVYKPEPWNGPLAGELLLTLVLTAEQAKELKAHL